MTRKTVAVFGVVYLALGAALASWRWPRWWCVIARADVELRAQLKWLLFAVASPGRLGCCAHRWFRRSTNRRGSTIILALLLAGIPVSAAIAILRYRLYDVDVVINKTLVYGVLAVFVTVVYVALVVGIGTLVGGSGNLVLSIVATAVVAVAFQPMREWVQRFANRVVYGRAGDALRGAVGSLGKDGPHPGHRGASAPDRGHGGGRDRCRPGGGLAPGRTGLGAGGVSGQTQASPPLEPPTVVDGTGVGSRRRRRRPRPPPGRAPRCDQRGQAPQRSSQFGGSEAARGSRLQAGLVLRNVRLVEELRSSRQRLVTAQDEERRRLERNLHDGAQQRLVSIALALRMAREHGRYRLRGAGSESGSIRPRRSWTSH